MLFKNTPEKFWNLIAGQYARNDIPNETAYRAKLERMINHLTPDAIVLDIGCGTGTQCLDIAGSVKQVVGLDFSEKMLLIAEQRKADRHLDNVEFIRKSFFDESFNAESFDLVTAFYVMHFIDDLDAAFKRIYELLKPGGMFVSETACLGERSKLVGKLLQFTGNFGLIPEINLLTTEEIVCSIERAGFTLVDKVKYNPMNHDFTLFASKI